MHTLLLLHLVLCPLMFQVKIMGFVAQLVIWGAVAICSTSGSRILLVPPASHSHTMQAAMIGKGLVERGHEVYLLAPEEEPMEQYTTKLGIQAFRFRPEKTLQVYTPELLKKISEKHFEGEVNLVLEIAGTLELMSEVCIAIYEDQLSMKRLSELQLDFILLDSFPTAICFYLLPHKLGVPYGSYGEYLSMYHSRVPLLPSFVPAASSACTEKMNFLQRTSNLLSTIPETLLVKGCSWYYRDYMSIYAPERPQVTLEELFMKSSVWLLDTHTVLDYPKPTMPNVIHVGGLTVKPRKALPPDLEKLLGSSKHGVILVSFGSLTTHFPEAVVQKLIEVFKLVKQTVIFRYSGPVLDNQPQNLVTMKWLPQNDLLGHAKVKLFITHCGANGQFEALYNGVPMIGLPIFGDQPYNAQRVEYRGYGLKSDMHTFTAKELFEKINRVWNNKTFTENIKKASAIYRSDPMTPQQRAAYWIEHVIKHGDKHLRSYALEMPFYQYIMLDIVAFIAVIIILVLLICIKIIHITWKWCRKSDKLKTN